MPRATPSRAAKATTKKQQQRKATARTAPPTKATKSRATKATKTATATKASRATGTSRATRASGASTAGRGAGTAKTVRAAKVGGGTKVTKVTKKAAGTKDTRDTAKKDGRKRAAATRAPATLDKFLEGQRSALLEERETYTRQASSLRAEAEQLAADREPGDVQFDEESGQGDSMNVERERDLVLSAQALSAVEDIDKALSRIEAGSYGVCERCGESIPRERLKALPYASLCVKCKSGGLSRR
jgi:RNA polymerase-binding transcription factor DksA